MTGRAVRALVLPALLVGTGCGGGEEPVGDPVAGKRIAVEVAEPSCGRCHTLADAEFEGTVAPDLDELRPGYQRVLDALRRGPGVMPSYDDQLSDRELHDVAAYVSGAASR